MHYVVSWLKDDQVVAEARFDKFVEAKLAAFARMPAHRARKGATSVTVRDDNDVLYVQAY